MSRSSPVYWMLPLVLIIPIATYVLLLAPEREPGETYESQERARPPQPKVSSTISEPESVGTATAQENEIEEEDPKRAPTSSVSFTPQPKTKRKPPPLCKVIGTVVEEVTGYPIPNVLVSLDAKYFEVERTKDDGSFEFLTRHVGPAELCVYPTVLGDDRTWEGSDSDRLLRHRLSFREMTLKQAEEGPANERKSSLFTVSERGLENVRFPKTRTTQVAFAGEVVINVGTLRMGRAGTLELRVRRFRTGEPVQGTYLVLPAEGWESARLLVGPTDAEGVSQTPFPPGAYDSLMLTTDYEGYRVMGCPYRAVVESGKTSFLTVNVDAKRFPRITGTQDTYRVRVISKAGLPVIGCKVACGDYLGHTGEKGTVTLDASEIAPGPLHLVHGDYVEFEDPHFAPRPSGRTQYILESKQSLKLSVRNSAGEPVPSLRIRAVQDREMSYLDIVGVSVLGRTWVSEDPDGVHRVPLRAEHQPFVLLLDGDEAGHAELGFSEGQSMAGTLDVFLKPLERVRGRLVDSRGRAMASATVLSLSPQQPLDLLPTRFQNPLESRSIVSRTLGQAKSRTDGSFELLAPKRNGVLLILSASNRGRILSYESNHQVGDIEIPDPISIRLKPRTHREEGVRIVIDFKDKRIRYFSKAFWAPGDREVTTSVPFPGQYRVRVESQPGAPDNVHFDLDLSGRPPDDPVLF